MDELEFLKKDWKKQDGNYPKVKLRSALQNDMEEILFYSKMDFYH